MMGNLKNRLFSKSSGRQLRVKMVHVLGNLQYQIN